jgi:hypothetical protein
MVDFKKIMEGNTQEVFIQIKIKDPLDYLCL